MNDPLDPQALHLVDELIAATDDPAALFPMGQNNYAGTVACRAYVQHRRGETNDAVELLRHLMVAVPDKPWASWGVRWLAERGAAARVEAMHVTGMLGFAIREFPELVVTDRSRLERLQPYVNAADAALAAHPNDATVLGICSVVYRKAGRFEDAVALGERAHAVEPNYLAGTARAMAYQAAGRAEDAIAAYRDMATRIPDDPQSRTDLALMLIDAGRLDEALRWTEEAVRIDPKHRTSEGLVLFLRHRVHGDESAGKAFERYLRDRPGHLLEYLARPAGQPYVNYLPQPQEATINVLKQLLSEEAMKDVKEAGDVQVSVSHLEAPSSRLASTLALPAKVNVRFAVGAVPEPDPRKPVRAVEHVLWTYNGTDPSRGLAPPTREDVVGTVAALAGSPFDVEAWWAEAGPAARALGPGAVRELLATMVHPPPAPSPGLAVLHWMPHVQTAAAMIVAQVDDGWEGSARKRALESLVLGPVDWTTTAGIVALAQLGCTEGVDVRPLLVERLQNTPRAGYCCYLHALVCCALRLPHLDASERLEFEAWRADLEREDDGQEG